MTLSDKQPYYSSEDIISAYQDIFENVWNMVSDIVGELTLELIVKISIKKVATAFEFLKYIEVSSEGISLDNIKKKIKNISLKDLEKGFQSLFSEILTNFNIMWGNIIIKELALKLKNVPIKD